MRRESLGERVSSVRLIDAFSKRARPSRRSRETARSLKQRHTREKIIVAPNATSRDRAREIAADDATRLIRFGRHVSTVVRHTASHDSSESPSLGPRPIVDSARRVASRRVASRRVVSLAPVSERRGGWRHFTAFAPSGCVANRARAESGPRDEIRRSRGECATDRMID